MKNKIRTILVIITLIMLIIASNKIDLKTDLSVSGDFSLHPALLRTIVSMEKEVSIVALWQKDSEGRFHEYLNNVFKETAKQENITYSYFDPILDKSFIKELEKESKQKLLPNTIYLMSEDSRIIKIPMTGRLFYTLNHDLAVAILALSNKDRMPVYFLSGYGTLDISKTGENGISHFYNSLDISGYKPRKLSSSWISKHGRLPDDGVVVIAGARALLGKDMLKYLLDYQRDGGSLLILGDDKLPIDLALYLRKKGLLIGSAFSPNLSPKDIFSDKLLKDHNFILSSAKHSKIGKQRRFDRILLEANDLSTHEITARAKESGREVISPYTVAPLIPLPYPTGRKEFIEAFTSVGTPQYKQEILLRKKESDVWLSKNGDTKVLANSKDPIFAIATTYAPAEDSVKENASSSKMVFWASRQAASDEIISTSTYANELLLIDMISWLSNTKNEFIDIPPRKLDMFQVNATEGGMNIIVMILVVIIPCLFIGVAIMMWLERR